MDGPLLCVQRVLHPENSDFDDVVSGVTRHYVRALRGSLLDNILRGLVDADILMVDASSPTEYASTAIKTLAGDLVDMLIAAVSARETGVEPPARGRTKDVPTVVELDDRIWHPRCASANTRNGPTLVLLQYRDDEVFAARFVSQSPWPHPCCCAQLRLRPCYRAQLRLRPCCHQSPTTPYRVNAYIDMHGEVIGEDEEPGDGTSDEDEEDEEDGEYESDGIDDSEYVEKPKEKRLRSY